MESKEIAAIRQDMNTLAVFLIREITTLHRHVTYMTNALGRMPGFREELEKAFTTRNEAALLVINRLLEGIDELHPQPGDRGPIGLLQELLQNDRADRQRMTNDSQGKVTELFPREE